MNKNLSHSSLQNIMTEDKLVKCYNFGCFMKLLYNERKQTIPFNCKRYAVYFVYIKYITILKSQINIY